MADPEQLLAPVFRHGYSRIVAALTRTFGAGRLDLIEDAVQEALLRAVRLWPVEGAPEQPEGWLLHVARNVALDHLKRRQVAQRGAPELERAAAAAQAHSAPATPQEIQDDTLRLMFVCCHPTLAPASRVALTLKTLCGLGTAEIASALLAQEATVAQRLSRAKAQLQREQPVFEVPRPQELGKRLDTVLEVLYLLFNAGYRAHRGEALVRQDLVHEAIRLAGLLLDVPETRAPKVHALLALMLLLGARLPARSDALGEPLTLAEQDRGLWDRAWIGRALTHLAQAAAGEELTPYHVQAAIASCHAAAREYADTDWAAILGHYDLLLVLEPTAVVRLNRAVAVAKVHGAGAGLLALEQLDTDAALEKYYLLPAVRAQLLWALGRREDAARYLRAALTQECSAPERALLQRRLAACLRGEAAPAW